MTYAPPSDRDASQALWRGFRGRCPACGRGRVLRGYLAVADACDACGQAFHHHRADDAPAWATMVVVGHLMAPLIVMAMAWKAVPVWVHSTVWPLVALGLCLALLPPIKGAVVGYQWAHRMHGFGEDAASR